MYLTNSVRFFCYYKLKSQHGKQHTNLAKYMEKMYFMLSLSRYHIIATYIKGKAYTAQKAHLNTPTEPSLALSHCFVWFSKSIRYITLEAGNWDGVHDVGSIHFSEEIRLKILNYYTSF